MSEQKEPTAAKPLVHKDMITDKLLEFQKRVNAIPKDATNPFFHSKYFNVNTVIGVIKPMLNEVGLVLMQPVMVLDGKNVLSTEILDGRNTIAISRILLPEISDVQKFGAALTYIRRYALVSLLLLQGEEDDDGNKAVTPNPAPRAVKNVQTVNNPVLGTAASNSTNKGLPMSDKQNKMIHALMKEKGLTSLKEAGIEKIEHPTITDASAIIKKLMEYSSELPTIQMDEPNVADIQSGPYNYPEGD